MSAGYGTGRFFGGVCTVVGNCTDLVSLHYSCPVWRTVCESDWQSCMQLSDHCVWRWLMKLGCWIRRCYTGLRVSACIVSTSLVTAAYAKAHAADLLPEIVSVEPPYLVCCLLYRF